MVRQRWKSDQSGFVLEPEDFMARLAALVPPPRMHLTRHHLVADVG